MSGSQKNKSKGCSEPEAAIKRRIAKRAATLGAELPSELPSAEQKLANLLSATRVLMAECALANSWDKAEAASYAGALDFAEVVLNSLLLRQEPGQQKPRPQNAVPQRGYVTKNATQQTAAISALSISVGVHYLPGECGMEPPVEHPAPRKRKNLKAYSF